MITTIDAVFEKGLFRPLQPVAIPENRRLRINFEEVSQNGTGDLTHPRLQPREYHEDYPEVPDSDYEYIPIPPKAIHSVQAKVIFAGKLQPAPYPEED